MSIVAAESRSSGECVETRIVRAAVETQPSLQHAFKVSAGFLRNPSTTTVLNSHYKLEPREIRMGENPVAQKANCLRSHALAGR
jgi:hypothetical protein